MTPGDPITNLPALLRAIHEVKPSALYDAKVEMTSKGLRVVRVGFVLTPELAQEWDAQSEAAKAPKALAPGLARIIGDDFEKRGFGSGAWPPDSPQAERLRPHLRDGEMLVHLVNGECHVVQTHAPGPRTPEPRSEYEGWGL